MVFISLLSSLFDAAFYESFVVAQNFCCYSSLLLLLVSCYQRKNVFLSLEEMLSVHERLSYHNNFVAVGTILLPANTGGCDRIQGNNGSKVA